RRAWICSQTYLLTYRRRCKVNRNGFRHLPHPLLRKEGVGEVSRLNGFGAKPADSALRIAADDEDLFADIAELDHRQVLKQFLNRIYEPLVPPSKLPVILFVPLFHLYERAKEILKSL